MTVSVHVFDNGEKIEERIFGGKKIETVIEYLNEKGISFRADKGAKEATEISKHNKSKLIYLDNMNLLDVEGVANFYSEYLLEYDEEVYRKIISLLN